MTSLIPRPSLLPDLFRFLEGGWPTSYFGEQHPVRIEDYVEDGTYVLRAELPGMDPSKDIHVAVEGDELTISAERTVQSKDKTHSEFSYGSFARTVRLPGGVDADKVKAGYEAGILEVRVPMREQVKPKKIPVTAIKS